MWLKYAIIKKEELPNNYLSIIGAILNFNILQLQEIST
jgi:hypothetical protein